MHEPVGPYPQKYSMRATGGVYLGFRTLRGRKFPYGNFWTSVFCEVKTQIVGKTKFFDSLTALFSESGQSVDKVYFHAGTAAAR